MSTVNQKTVNDTTARVTEHRLDPVTEPRAVRWILTAVALIFLALFLVVPLVAVFAQAFAKGVDYYFDSLKDPDAWSAIKLTLIVAAIAVPLNVVSSKSVPFVEFKSFRAMPEFRNTRTKLERPVRTVRLAGKLWKTRHTVSS